MKESSIAWTGKAPSTWVRLCGRALARRLPRDPAFRAILPWLVASAAIAVLALAVPRNLAPHAARIVAAAGAAALATGGLLLALAKKAATRHMRRIADAADAIARGELRHRLRADGKDDLGLAGRAFDRMLDSLEGAYRQVTALNRSLEQRTRVKLAELDRETEVRCRLERELRLAREGASAGAVAAPDGPDDARAGEIRRLEEEMSRSLGRLRTALEGTVRAMSRTVEMRDLYTAGHQRRVANLAAAIARDLGLPEDKVDGIRTAGAVHDLGKIAAPADILTKPSRLSPTEFHLIRDHPRVGYEILKTIDFPWPVAQMVLQHHERLDGTGYPDGLRGDSILLEARILAVADVVEAISSHRPYRPSLGIESALQEIRSGRGAAFDADAVDACVALFGEGRFRFEDDVANGSH